MIYCQISKIEQVNYNSYEYDIGVDKVDNFFANNILVHNCKSDGMRCHLSRSGPTVTAWTRNGREIRIHDVLTQSALHLMKDGETWDGELVCYRNGKPLDRKTSNGICNKGIKDKGMSVEEAALIRFICWDIVDFTSTIPYSERLEELYSRFENVEESNFIPVISVVVNSEEEGVAFYEQCISNGEEGSIEKNMNSVWEPKRTKNLGKRKAEEEADLRVVGVTSGEGKSDKFAGLIGALQCETEDGLCKVNVSGFDYDTRVDITNNPSKYIGRVCTVKYNMVISDKKTGQSSLFLPRWVELREDKNTANTLLELK